MRFHSESTSKTSPLASLLRGRLAARRSRSVDRAARQVVEQLESRRLLAVVAAGETGFFYNGTSIIRVSVTSPSGKGSITLVGFTRPKDATAGGRTGVSELPMIVFEADGGTHSYGGGFNDGTAPAGGGTVVAPPINEIYSIYSGDSTADTSVAISTSSLRTGTGSSIGRLVGGNVQPFGGTAGQLRTIMLDPGDDNDRTIALTNGGVFLGGRAGSEEAQLTAVYSQTKTASIVTSPGVSLKKNATLKPGVYVNGSFDNFFFGGTITGAINISGSVDTFYAGNILTGDVTRGSQSDQFNPVLIGTDNFNVGGDLRNLITSGGVGTVNGAPDAFVPNTDIQVGGRIQQIKANGDFRASVDAVGGYNAATSDGSDLTELETRRATNTNANAIGAEFYNYRFINQGFSNNSSFDTPQILGSYFSPTRKRGQQVTLNGNINNLPNVGDASDFYGLPLMAGQSAVVQVVSTGFSPVAVQVYDPDGNVVFSDYSNQNAETFQNRAFTVKADQPGLWRVEVVPYEPSLLTERTYTLTLDKIGELAIGGVQAGGDVYASNPAVGIRGRNADVGAVLAGNELYSALGLIAVGGQPDVTNPIVSDKGNVRSVEGDQYGHLGDSGLETASYPTIMAGKSVGLVRANVGRLYFNQYSRFVTTATQDDRPSSNLVIGGDYQVIETPGDFTAVLAANGGIGVIRVGSVGVNIAQFIDPGYFQVNVDNSGNDGVIGLIDVVGDFGTFTTGGPAISGGAGSNVRYIRVSGNAYRDRQFGAGNTIVQTTTATALDPISDDSGALITITPIASETYTAPADVPVVDPTTDGGLFGTGSSPPIFGSPTSIPNPFGGTTAIPTTDTNGDGVIDEDDLPVDDVDGDGNVDGAVVAGTVTVETYPVRSGGSVILSVTASQGVQINTTGRGVTAAGEIGELLTGNEGAQIITNSDPNSNTPSTEPAAELASGQTLEVLLTGTVRTSVFSIAGETALADYTRIVNTTDGEIVNLNADSVAYLEAQYLGTARTAANVTLEGLNPINFGIADLVAVGSQKNAIRMVNGIEIRSRGAIGNVAASGMIQNVIANSDQINARGQVEGIVGIVYAGSELRHVDIGEGLSTSGTGIQQVAGLFSSDTIGTVTNVNGGGHIRGDIVFRENLESITLTGGGSIVDADILQAGNVTGPIALLDGDERNNETTIALVGGFDSTSGIGSITITGGDGGIMSAQIVGLNIGLTTVGAGGFGVLTSRFFSSGGGRMLGISAAGLGIRGTEYTGGGTMGDIVATGGGALADLNEYTDAIRASRDSAFDSNNGIAPNASNDVYLYFQTSPADSQIVGVTNEGIIADSTIAASQSIGNIRAFDFRTFNNPSGIKARAESFPNQINFGQSIGSITAKRDINGLRVVGGSVGSIVARDIKNFQLQTTGAVGTINAKRNVLGSVNFNLINDGALANLLVGGDFSGTLYAARGIDRVVIDGDFGSQSATGGFYSGVNIRSIRIGGDVREGAYLRARKKINGITINGDLKATSTIRANPFGTITIKGATEGKIQRN